MKVETEKVELSVGSEIELIDSLENLHGIVIDLIYESDNPVVIQLKDNSILTCSVQSIKRILK